MENDPGPVNGRHIDFEGTRNFRDMGGIPTASGMTRFGVVYRSDRLSSLSEADGSALGALGITTIIDMRSDDERGRAPNRLPRDTNVRQLARAFLPRHTVGMFDAINSGKSGAEDAYAMMLRQYRALALDHIADYRRILDDLLAPGAMPAVIHCTSGKDRTGMVAAIVLLALGAPESAITADYVMTQDRIEKVDYFNDTADPAAIDVVMAAKPDYLEEALRAMRDAYGSIDRYLADGIGLGPAKRARIAELLTTA